MFDQSEVYSITHLKTSTNLKSGVDRKVFIPMQTYFQDKKQLTLLNGIEYFFNTWGEMIVILCLKNAGQDLQLVGKNPLANRSRRRPCSGGIPYLQQIFINRKPVNFFALALEP